MTELVQPIVMLRFGSHEDAVRCVAEASLRAYVSAPDLPEWEQWLAGSFTKTVRRARPAEYEKARAAGPLAEVRRGEAAALAFAPAPTDKLPRPIARLQVSGTELPRLGWPEDEGAACRTRIALNADLGMSTGKTAAQAAHAMWAVWLQLGELDRAAWLDEGLAARFEGVAGDNLALGKVTGAVLDAFGAELGVKAYAAIHDNGRTEVDPGSLTAVGIRAWW